MFRSAEQVLRRPWLPVAVFAAIATVKLVAIVVDGPASTQDSTAYVLFADQLQAGYDWLSDPDLHERGLSASALRMIGYPALIVAACRLAGEHFDLLLVVLQCTVSLVANIMVYRLSRRLMHSIFWALVAAVLYAKTIVFQYDLYLLTDSLFGSLYTIVLAQLTLAALDARLPRMRALLGLGILLACALLLREVALYWIGCVIVMFLVAARSAGQGIAGTMAALGALVLPLVIVLSAYMTWNHARTGRAFLTAGNATALMVPFLEVPVESFEGDTPLDKIARDKLQKRNFDEILEIVDALHEHYGLSVVDMAPVVRNRFIRSVFEHPAAYFVHALKSFVWFSPQMLFETPRVVYLIAGRKGQDFRSRWRILKSSGGILDWFQLALECVFAGISMLLFALFLLGPPIQWARTLWRREAIPQELVVLGVLWLTYMVNSWMYHYVHFETRYITGVLFCALILALRMLQRLEIPSRVVALATSRSR